MALRLGLWARGAFVGLWCTFALATACHGETTHVLVVFDADPSLRELAHELRIRVWNSEEAIPVYNRSFIVEGANADASFPVHLPLVPRDGDATRRYSLEADLLDSASNVVSSVRLTGGYAAGAARTVELLFDEPCVGVACGASESCREGACVDACVIECSSEPPRASEARSVRAPSFSTRSPTQVPVPGSELSFTPTSIDETWLILMSAALSSTTTSADRPSVELSYTVNGVLRGRGGVEVSRAEGGGPFMHFDVVTGTTSTQVIEVFAKEAGGGEASVQGLKVVAFPLPSDADPHFASAEGPILVTGNAWQAYHSLAILPESEGDYVIFGLVNATERPGDMNVMVRFGDSTGNLWPSRLSNSRRPLQSFFAARVLPIAQGGASGAPEVTLDARVDGVDPGTLEYARLLAFRSDAFDPFSLYLEPSAQVVDTPEAQTIASVETPRAAPTGLHLYVQYAVAHTAECSSPMDLAPRVLAFDAGGVTSGYAHVVDNCAYVPTYGAFGTLAADGPRVFQNRAATGTAGAAIEVLESGILVFGLP